MLMKEKEKASTFVVSIDLKSIYPTEIATSLIRLATLLYNSRSSMVKETTLENMLYVSLLSIRANSGYHNLCLREFSKSLTNDA